MKVCIKDKKMNFDYIKIYGEEKAKANGYTLYNVPKGYEDCAFEDFDNNGFNVELYNKRKQGYANHKKLTQLTNWFDNYFDKQLTQSQWQDDFTVSKDAYFKDESGQPKTYANIDELKEQAKIVRDEIRRLRQN